MIVAIFYPVYFAFLVPLVEHGGAELGTCGQRLISLVASKCVRVIICSVGVIYGYVYA